MPADSTYRRWAHGLCPCCGSDLCESVNDVQPKSIGEGVMICGRCVENEHDEPPAILEAMLKAIILRDDEPVEEAIEHAPHYNLVTDPVIRKRKWDNWPVSTA